MSDPERPDVTVVVRRRVRGGREQDYEDWLGRLTAAVAQDFPGYLGAEFHRPGAGRRDYVSVFRFASLATLEAFERSDLRAGFLREVAPLVESDAVWERMTGLEFWFDPPPGTQVPQPHRGRMCLLLIGVVFTLVYVIGGLLSLVIGDWPYPLRLLFTLAIEVPLLTYVIMPALTPRLSGWIYPATRIAT